MNEGTNIDNQDFVFSEKEFKTASDALMFSEFTKEFLGAIPPEIRVIRSSKHIELNDSSDALELVIAMHIKLDDSTYYSTQIKVPAYLFGPNVIQDSIIDRFVNDLKIEHAKYIIGAGDPEFIHPLAHPDSNFVPKIWAHKMLADFHEPSILAQITNVKRKE